MKKLLLSMLILNGTNVIPNSLANFLFKKFEFDFDYKSNLYFIKIIIKIFLNIKF